MTTIAIKAMSNQEAVRQMMATQRIEGFTFNKPALEMWGKVENGTLTTADVRQKVLQSVDELRKKFPDCFVEPDMK